MSLDVFKAVIRGYSDHLFDLQILSVYQGYWAGYYTRTKKPKNLEVILKKLLKARSNNGQKKSQKKATEVDVDTFLMREQMRLSKFKK